MTDNIPDIKLTKPSVVEEIKYFNVLHFLYCDQVSDGWTALDGFSICISKKKD